MSDTPQSDTSQKPVEYIVVDEDGDTHTIDTTGLSRRELARQFIQQSGELSRLHHQLGDKALHPDVVEATKLRLNDLGHRINSLERMWVERVKRGEPVGTMRDIHVNSPENPF